MANGANEFKYQATAVGSVENPYALYRPKEKVAVVSLVLYKYEDISKSKNPLRDTSNIIYVDSKITPKKLTLRMVLKFI